MHSPGSWRSVLDLRYTSVNDKTLDRAQHCGAVRVLAALHPEGPGICHHVLVHPPGGLVGGDRIEMTVDVGASAHALITTPGATRFYRSLGQPAVQQVLAQLRSGARLEWLPLEALAFDACLAENRGVFTLETGAEMIGWDMLALGLPAAGQAFRRGHVVQHLELPGIWLERGRIDAQDDVLLRAPGGLAGHTAMGTLWFAAGSAIAGDRAQVLLSAAREVLQECLDGRIGRVGLMHAAATQPNPQVLVVRALAARIEPIHHALTEVWAAWRSLAWQLGACTPRVWRT
ncbi:MAG: urease accessory protein UreD [Proteobacteria bacterium]|nr:urease accessory protein UreD [Pseudomonadota bacterium]